MAKMKAVQVPKAGVDFEIVEREIPSRARARCEFASRRAACATAMCSPRRAACPGIAYPRVPGHEVAGVIDDVGAGVTQWKRGQRVGVGWHGGQDGNAYRAAGAILPTA